MKTCPLCLPAIPSSKPNSPVAISRPSGSCLKTPVRTACITACGGISNAGPIPAIWKCWKRWKTIWPRKADPGDLGAEGLFRYLEDSLSNGLRMSDPEAIEVEDFDRALNRLYRQNVQSNVIPFHTHLPLYSLRVAAGEFLENKEVSAGRLDRSAGRSALKPGHVRGPHRRTFHGTAHPGWFAVRFQPRRDGLARGSAGVGRKPRNRRQRSLYRETLSQ